MRVIHLSTDDALAGAGRAAARLHAGLLRAGCDSSMLVLVRRGKDPTVARFEPPGDFASKVRRRLRSRRIARDYAPYVATRPPGYERFSDDRTPDGPALAKQLPPCDVLNLHHITGLVDHEGLLCHLPPRLPVVWRLADMAPLTGGCHYEFGCGRFTAQCGACPQLGSKVENDLSHQVWRRKRNALGAVADRLHLAATSNWIANEARRSSLLKQFPITVIPNGLDVEDFAPRDRTFARNLLGLPQSARIVLFVAASLQNRRKGFSLLVEALGGLGEAEVGGGVMLASVGAKPPPDLAVSHTHLGVIDNDRMLSLAYSAADVFVIPSLQESFGQTVSESLACGTPVVGFATGGMLDMVRPGQTGALPVGDAAALRAAIIELLRLTADPETRARYSGECRKLALAEYAMDVQARRYLRLYESMVSG